MIEKLENIIELCYTQILKNKEVNEFQKMNWLRIVKEDEYLNQTLNLLFELYSKETDTLTSFAIKVMNKEIKYN